MNCKGWKENHPNRSTGSTTDVRDPMMAPLPPMSGLVVQVLGDLV